MRDYVSLTEYHYRTAVYEPRTYGGVRGALRSILGGAVYSIMLFLGGF